jgi:type I restriction enzyme S subunit
MEFKEIGDILELQRGYDLPVDSMVQGDIPVVGSNGIVGYHNTCKSITPTITLGRSGTIGKVHYYNRDTWVHNTAMYVSNFKGNNPLYLYYLLDNLNFENFKSSSVVPSLNRNYVYPVKVPFYSDIRDQEKIANCLSIIDQKIALNTRMNAELEAMAKQLYDYWFVQFDFPDENGNPYKSSGGKMVYNSTLKREIPAGWEIKNLNQLAVSYRGVTYTKEDLIPESTDSILVLRGNNIPSSGQFTYDNNVAFIPRSMISKEQKINKGDIIITMSSGSKEHIGKCFMFQRNSDHTYGAFLSKFVPSDHCKFYVYLSMLSEFFKAFVKTTCNGTGINNLTNDTFSNVYFPIPSSKTLSKFESIIGSFYNKVGVNQDQMNDLTHLRDSLLPMLMNGQVTVE